MLWQHVVLFKPYGAESARECGCVCRVLCCVRLYEMHGAKIKDFSKQFIRYWTSSRRNIKKLLTHLIRKSEAKKKINIGTERGLVFPTTYCSRYCAPINVYKVSL